MKYGIILILISFSNIIFGQIERYIPCSNSSQTVSHKYYTLSYSEKDEQAEWVIYFLTKDRLVSGNEKRLNNFRPDPMISTGSSELVDFKGSGYDRGHLVPAGDMKFSFDAMSESFFLSNITPQEPGFNRGIWLRLENLVREWALLYDSLYIVTAGILNADLEKIGPNEVSIPDYFYKVVLRVSSDDVHAICIVLPNQGKDEDLQEFVVPIDSLEKLTEIDFFCGLDKSLQAKIECCVDTSSWKWFDRMVKEDRKVTNQIILVPREPVEQHQKIQLVNPADRESMLFAEKLNSIENLHSNSVDSIRIDSVIRQRPYSRIEEILPIIENDTLLYQWIIRQLK